MVAATLDNRPREERDFKDFYNDLEESSRVPVFFTGSCQNINTGPKRNLVSFDVPETKKPKPKGVVKCARPLDGKPVRISKTLASFGYKGKSTIPNLLRETYTRRDGTKRSSKTVCYDMDEQDAAWLEWLNERLTAAVILEEAFEIAISTLESLWAALEARMEHIAPSGLQDSSVLTLDADYSRYGSDDGTGGAGSLTEQRCAVCNDLECENTNAIVFCDGCNIAVHQECYGIAFIPEGHWYCRRCMVSKGTPVSCTFCPSKTGAFKQLDNGLWSHVVCALWINEVYFANPIYMEPIEGVDNIPKNRWKLICYICKQRAGACIQCSNRNCFLAYHVTCAKRAGSYMAMEKGVLGAVASKATLKSFCDKHGPSEWNREQVLLGIAQTRRFYRDCQLLVQQNDRLTFRRQQQNRQNAFKWKTEAGTPIAPQKFIDDLELVMLQLNCKVDSNHRRALRGQPRESDTNLPPEKGVRYACAALCRYWCLKRESKRGAPLVRFGALNQEFAPAEDTSHTSQKEAGEQQKLQNSLFGNLLQDDLKQLISMCQLAKDRQFLLREQSETTFDMADTCYFPISTVALNLLKSIQIESFLSKLLQSILNGVSATEFKLDAGSEQITVNPKDLENSQDIEIARTASAAIRLLLQDLGLHRLQSCKEINETMESAVSSVANAKSTPKSIRRAASSILEKWSAHILPELKRVEASSKAVPCVENRGLNFELKSFTGFQNLATEDLSEIEYDPFTDPKTERAFREFLST
ncbi:hypothetical protein PUMCH_004047 [Australozyma saopauloensis]|uniref:Uncharacterized protein n=1 Tax=Australozyma saopauloensis TaxID=291208 RepID=A0AAX4HDI6_9ASCO|nr:hypothetical protein PUMCH_004047 [[Candida] saopauloensis]